MNRSYKCILLFVFLFFWNSSVAPAGTADAAYCDPGISECVGDDIARFYARGIDINTLPPSFAFVKPLRSLGKLTRQWPTMPLFQNAKNEYSVCIDIDANTSLYGTGEIAGPLLRNGSKTQTWNTDSWSYTKMNKELYQSHPWVLAVRKDGSSFGVLADTTYRCRIDLQNHIKISTAGQPFAVIIIEGKSPQIVLKKLAKLIGTMELLPKWALGYHQSRYSYLTAARVMEVADEFRKRHIPCDTLWFDIDYMDRFKIFTWSPENFSDPKGLIRTLHSKGFQTVCIIDPGVKKEKGYFVYDQGTAGNYWVLTADGKEFNGEVWPGICTFPDFSRDKVRKWWADLVSMFVAFGIDGIWIDMNEPAVWDQLAKTMPENCIFGGDANLPAGTHTQYHNVYGMLEAMATRDGLIKGRPDQRPFVLTRANYIGGQRYAACWTGDNAADWDHLDNSVSMALNLGLSGQPMSGPDIGGFAGNGSPELYARWMGVGSLLPFSRGHTEKGNVDKEPWAFGLAIENSCRNALQRRYRLLPYMYTLAYEASLEGLPIVRPVFFADPQDLRLRSEDDAFLLGSDLLIIPQLSKDKPVARSLPKGIWREVNILDQGEAGDVNLPKIKIRGGSIVPLGKVIENSTQESLDPLTLLICFNNNGTASGRLYEDAGDGFGYRKGLYILTEYTAQQQNGTVSVRVKSRTGKLTVPPRNIVIKIISENGVIQFNSKDADSFIADIDLNTVKTDALKERK